MSLVLSLSLHWKTTDVFSSFHCWRFTCLQFITNPGTNGPTYNSEHITYHYQTTCSLLSIIDNATVFGHIKMLRSVTAVSLRAQWPTKQDKILPIINNNLYQYWYSQYCQHVISNHLNKCNVMWHYIYYNERLDDQSQTRVLTSRWSVVALRRSAQSALSRSYTVESAPLQYSVMFPCWSFTITCDQHNYIANSNHCIQDVNCKHCSCCNSLHCTVVNMTVTFRLRPWP